MALTPVKSFTKDPDALLDYGLDWTDWLGDDTLLTSVWVIPAGIAKAAEVTTATTTLIWLSGGTAGVRYTCTNRVVTVGGRMDDRSIQINVDER